jgi:hypothetical protein
MKRMLLFVGLVVAMAAADNGGQAYEKGTITRPSPTAKDYEIRGSVGGKMFKRCGDFKNGQAVNFLVVGKKVLIRDESGKNYKCEFYASMDPTGTTGLGTQGTMYLKGTILGWNTRVDTSTSGSNGQSLHAVFGNQRRTRIFELQGQNYVYAVDDCGSFQAGQFKPGQVVEYRVDDSSKNDKRIYIRHNGNKEYSCRMEGVRVLDAAGTSAPAAQEPAK